MTNLSIDRRKLKLKHYLNVQKNCKDYLDDEDYLYELVSALEQTEMLYEPFTATFAKRNIRDFAAKTDKEEKAIYSHQNKLLEFVKAGILEVAEKGGINLQKYKLVQHPWL